MNRDFDVLQAVFQRVAQRLNVLRSQLRDRTATHCDVLRHTIDFQRVARKDQSTQWNAGGRNSATLFSLNIMINMYTHIYAYVRRGNSRKAPNVVRPPFIGRSAVLS